MFSLAFVDQHHPSREIIFVVKNMVKWAILYNKEGNIECFNLQAIDVFLFLIISFSSCVFGWKNEKIER